MIKEDLLKVFTEFHNSGVIDQSIYATFIALVPKRSQTIEVSKFRPINLVVSLYSIVS